MELVTYYCNKQLKLKTICPSISVAHTLHMLYGLSDGTLSAAQYAA
jgi:hypothetical protein